MAEEYQGTDFLAQNQNAIDKAAEAQNAQNQAGAKAGAGAKAQNDAAKQKKSAATARSNAASAQAFSNVKAGMPAPGSVETTSPALATSLGPMPTAHTGGRVTKTGLVDVKRGEQILSPSRASEYRKVFSTRKAAGKHNWGGK